MTVKTDSITEEKSALKWEKKKIIKTKKKGNILGQN